MDTALQKVEQVDTCCLNELIAYIRCLNGVLREVGDGHNIKGRIEDWEHRTLLAYHALSNLTDADRQNDRLFIQPVFADLRELSDA